MRHNKKFNHLGRTASHRSAMLANMAISLIMHKRITTTVAKAKALKKYVEPLITKSKEDSTNSRRVVFSYLQNKEAIKELFGEVAQKVGDRPGGYPRIIKLGTRQGDAAQICFIELVDFDEAMAKETKKKATRRSRKAAPKAEGDAAPKAEAAPAEAPAAEEAKAEAPAAEGGETKQFVVGFDAEFPPMGFKDNNGDYVGFDLDLAKEVADRLGYEFVAKPISWDAKDQELESGNIDCIWNGFTISGREDKYTWTDAYMENNQVVVVNADSDIKSLADLAGKKVAVQKDSSGLAALEENTALTETFGDLVQTDSYLTALMDLESGGVDAIVMDEIVARYEIQTSGKNMVVLDEAIASEEYGVGFLLGNTELRDEVQAALDEMAKDGTLAEISNKWFGTDVTTVGK